MSLQKSIRRFGELALTGKYLTISDLVTAAACSATIGTAAHNLKLIVKDEGRIIATWQGRCPHSAIEAEYHRLRQSHGKSKKTAAQPKLSMEELNAAQEEMYQKNCANFAPTLRQLCDEIPHGEIIAIAERLSGAGYNVEISHPDGSFLFKIKR